MAVRWLMGKICEGSHTMVINSSKFHGVDCTSLYKTILYVLMLHSTSLQLLEPKEHIKIWSGRQEDAMNGTMDFGHNKIRKSVEEDRLSSLPDDLIHKILSFISIRHAIATSLLSSRWRSIWTSMPYLNFSCHDLIPNFVSKLLSRRNNQTQVSSVKLGQFSHESVKRILNYTFSLNVKQLTVTCDPRSNVGFPLSLFSSQSLEHLTVSGSVYAPTSRSTWDLPALTTLHLDHITLYGKCTDLFSKCTKLKNLSLKRCTVIGTNVVAPHLKNLAVKCCYGELMISVPDLTSLVIEDCLPLQLSAQGLCSLEKVDLCIDHPSWDDAHKIVSLLQQLHSLKLLTLNLGLLELLSSSMQLISHQPFAFANVKILKFTMISPVMVYLEVQAQEKVTMSTEIKNDDRSSSDIFTMVSCEEIRVMKDIISAQGLMEDLQVMLVKCKANSDTNKVHLEQPMESSKSKMHEHGKAQVKKQWAVQSSFKLQFGEMMEQINHGKFERSLTKLPTSETRHMISRLQQMISLLQSIEELLTELPASKRDGMQEIFYSLCEDAASLMNKLLLLYKVRMDEGMMVRADKVNRRDVTL